MPDRPSAELVEEFFTRVWDRGEFDVIDRMVAEDFVIESGGRSIEGRAAFKEWAQGFRAVISDFRFHIRETFQDTEGRRVTCLWKVTGRNNGAFGTEPDGQPVEMVGTAVWDVAEDGTLLRNRVERNAHEVHQQLVTR